MDGLQGIDCAVHDGLRHFGECADGDSDTPNTFTAENQLVVVTERDRDWFTASLKKQASMCTPGMIDDSRIIQVRSATFSAPWIQGVFARNIDNYGQQADQIQNAP